MASVHTESDFPAHIINRWCSCKIWQHRIIMHLWKFLHVLFLAARASQRGLFYPKNTPPERGIIQGDDHDAWCRVPPGESGISIRTRDYPRTDCWFAPPLRGIHHAFFIYKLFARQTTINWLNCEVFQFLENWPTSAYTPGMERIQKSPAKADQKDSL